MLRCGIQMYLKRKKCQLTVTSQQDKQKNFSFENLFSKQNPAGRGAADLAVGPPM
jgi:hypothetical protein